jgi:hypothetical protein
MRKIFCICLVCSPLISAKKIESKTIPHTKANIQKKELIITLKKNDVLLEAENYSF